MGFLQRFFGLELVDRPPDPLMLSSAVEDAIDRIIHQREHPRSGNWQSRVPSVSQALSVPAIVFAHATLLVAQFFESGTMTVLLFVGPVEPKHLADVDDSCLYWYFMTGSWMVLYLLVFISPRLA